MIAAISNVAHEILKNAYAMESSYRVIIFRFLLLIALGIYYALYGKERKYGKVEILLYLLAFFGGVYFLYIAEYSDYQFVILNQASMISFMCALYIGPVFLFVVKRFESIRCIPLEIVGKASYYIYSVQMVYYCFADEIVYPLKCAASVKLLIGVVFCVVVGILIYGMELRIKAIISNFQRKVVE